MKVKSLCSFNRSSGRDGAVKTAIKLKTAPDIVPHHAAKSTIVRGALVAVSTPEQKCIGSPEQKYINDVGKKPTELMSFSSGILVGMIRRRVRAGMA